MRTMLLIPARSRGAANASDAPELRLRVVTKAGVSKPSSAGRDYPLAKFSPLAIAPVMLFLTPEIAAPPHRQTEIAPRFIAPAVRICYTSWAISNRFSCRCSGFIDVREGLMLMIE
ncbi:hypothetical protein IG631_08611 [Alternaria alternata]|nr:hypothetical protein IG631_08611 [Alternaria alternata]